MRQPSADGLTLFPPIDEITAPTQLELYLVLRKYQPDANGASIQGKLDAAMGDWQALGGRVDALVSGGQGAPDTVASLLSMLRNWHGVSGELFKAKMRDAISFGQRVADAFYVAPHDSAWYTQIEPTMWQAGDNARTVLDWAMNEFQQVNDEFFTWSIKTAADVEAKRSLKWGVTDGPTPLAEGPNMPTLTYGVLTDGPPARDYLHYNFPKLPDGLQPPPRIMEIPASPGLIDPRLDLWIRQHFYDYYENKFRDVAKGLIAGLESARAMLPPPVARKSA